MASILDTGLVGVFSSIFTFLLVYAVTWGMLTWAKPFGDKNTGVYAIIGFSVALLCAVVQPITYFIGFIAPWYIAFALVLFFILFLVSMFGLSPQKDFPKIIGDSRVYIWIIIISIIIFMAGLAFTFGQTALEGTTGTTSTSTSGGNMAVIGASGASYYPPGTTVVNANSGTGSGTIGTDVPLGMAGQPGSTATPNFQTNMINTLLHPKVLGMLIILVIASISVYFLSSN